MKDVKEKRIIITGAGGFIGSQLVTKLLSLGYSNIVTIDRNLVNLKTLKNVRGLFSDEKVLQETLKKDDLVIHVACSSNPSISEQNIKEDIEENIIGSVKLMQICVQKKIDKFIYISSGGVVYGNCGAKKIKENDETSPISFHGAMKLSVENYLKVFSYLYGLKYVIIRPSNPYGRKSESKRKQGLIDIFLKKIKNEEKLEIWGDGEVVRDFIYIEDLVELIIKTFDSEIKNEILNAGTGVGTSINNFLDLVRKLTKKSIKVKYFKKRNFDVSYNVLDVKKAEKMLNWKPNKNLKRNIEKILQE